MCQDTPTQFASPEKHVVNAPTEVWETEEKEFDEQHENIDKDGGILSGEELEELFGDVEREGDNHSEEGGEENEMTWVGYSHDYLR
jgi:hypothetical protein